MASPRPPARAGQDPFPSAGSNPSSPSSEATEATAKQAKTKAALDLVPILGQGLVGGHPDTPSKLTLKPPERIEKNGGEPNPKRN